MRPARPRTVRPGEQGRLAARAEDGRLVLEPRAAFAERLRSRFRGVEWDVAAELIWERREAAVRETAG